MIEVAMFWTGVAMLVIGTVLMARAAKIAREANAAYIEATALLKEANDHFEAGAEAFVRSTAALREAQALADGDDKPGTSERRFH